MEASATLQTKTYATHTNGGKIIAIGIAQRVDVQKTKWMSTFALLNTTKSGDVSCSLDANGTIKLNSAAFDLTNELRMFSMTMRMIEIGYEPEMPLPD